MLFFVPSGRRATAERRGQISPPERRPARPHRGVRPAGWGLRQDGSRSGGDQEVSHTSMFPSFYTYPHFLWLSFFSSWISFQLLFGPGQLIFSLSTVKQVSNSRDNPLFHSHSLSVPCNVILSGPSECVWKASDSVCVIPGWEVVGITGIKERRRESLHGPNPPWQQHAAWSLFTLPPFIMDDLSNAQSYDDLHLIINYQQTPPTSPPCYLCPLLP